MRSGLATSDNFDRCLNLQIRQRSFKLTDAPI